MIVPTVTDIFLVKCSGCLGITVLMLNRSCSARMIAVQLLTTVLKAGLAIVGTRI